MPPASSAAVCVAVSASLISRPRVSAAAAASSTALCTSGASASKLLAFTTTTFLGTHASIGV